MKTRIIHTRFWQDQYISTLSKTEKLVFIYLLTNERVNICGIYEIPDKYICMDLDITIKELQPIKQRLQKDQRFIFYNGWVKIPKVEKYNSFLGEKNLIAKERELALVPSELIGDTYPFDTSIDTSIHTTLNHNQLSVINNKIEDVKEEDILSICKDYQVPEAFVRSKMDDIKNYTASTGKKYKDYVATLRNWVKRDSLTLRKEASTHESKRGIDARGIV